MVAQFNDLRKIGQVPTDWRKTLFKILPKTVCSSIKIPPNCNRTIALQIFRAHDFGTEANPSGNDLRNIGIAYHLSPIFCLQHWGFVFGNGEILTNLKYADDLMLYAKHCDELIFMMEKKMPLPLCLV